MNGYLQNALDDLDYLLDAHRDVSREGKYSERFAAKKAVKNSFVALDRASRKAALEEAMAVCSEEMMRFTPLNGWEEYNAGCQDCINAIKDML